MAGADGKGDLYAVKDKLAPYLGFQCKIPAIAGDYQFGHRTTVTQGTPPGALVIRAGFQQATDFFVFSTMIVTVEVTTYYRFTHESPKGGTSLHGPPGCIKRPQARKLRSHNLF
jgi:hypothetical protein